MGPCIERDRILAFLREIGIDVQIGTIEEPTFLPGMTIRDGGMVVDEAKLMHPGDLLHEAGHLAVMTPTARRQASAPIEGDMGLEIAAIAWSWAALLQVGLPAEVVFHPAGYQGGSEAFIENFSQRRFVGVSLLQWMGMTTEKEFPAMAHWLRQ